MPSSAISFDQTTFHNSFVDELPGEATMNNEPRQMPGVLYSRVQPTTVAAPRLLAWSGELAAELGLSRPPAAQGPAVDLLAGNAVAATMKPFAARYGGHQFGNWAGQLGDGRAMSLGELTAPDGRSWEIQLKGAGPTPYSRRADGRAVLRSSLREFLCSEAMHDLGVPTTRALSLVATGDQIVRDMFYSGNPQLEPGAVVARVAPTFVRFGSFQLLAAAGEIDNLRQLADYVIRHHFPELGAPSPAVYAAWFQEVCRRTALMAAHWQAVGFVHGVMNTDNMSILGLTIDYGPYGWLEPYEPDWTPNTTDFGGRRYAYAQQPRIARWNLAMLGHALTPLLNTPDGVAALNAGLDLYNATFAQTHDTQLAAKLGLTLAADISPDDRALLNELPEALEAAEADMTLFFRRLSHLAPALLADPADEENLFWELLDAVSYAAPGTGGARLLPWLSRYARRLRQETRPAAIIQAQMLAANPKYVLRNYLAQQAIEAAEAGDLSVLERLMAVLKTPFAEQPEHEELAARRPEWARDKAGCSTLSCSS